jgi:hypothetical protein
MQRRIESIHFAGLSGCASKIWTRQRADFLPGLAAQVHALYLRTNENATPKFEKLTPAYFANTGAISTNLLIVLLGRRVGRLHAIDRPQR